MSKKSILTTLAFLAVGAILLVIDWYVCPIKALIGYPCPGCGMTRALRSLTQWNFGSAWAYNPIVFLLPVYLLLVLFDGKPFVRKKSNRWLLWITVLLTVVLYLVRLLGWL